MTALAAPPTDEVETLIRNIGAEWARNWNAKNLDKLIASYAPDAVYMPPHHAAVHGRDKIREYLQTPLQHAATDLVYEVTYIKHSGDLAYDVGQYRLTVTHNGAQRKDQGKYLTVWRKQPGGDWKIAADCWSSDLAAEH